MENKNPEQMNMDLPVYSRFPKLADTRKKWIVGASVAVFLAAIIVVGTVTGVYMTQKHIEEMVTVAFANADGEKVVQTVSVNEREGVGILYVRSDKYSGTYLFDYRRKIIGIRRPNSTVCYILKMEDSNIPSLSGLLKGVEYFQTHDASTSDQMTFNLVLGEQADLAEVGTNVYLMCSDAAIYWAKNVDPKQKTWDLHIEIGSVHLDIEIDWPHEESTNASMLSEPFF